MTLFEQYMRGEAPSGVQMGEVTKACGGPRFTVLLEDGTEPICIKISAKLKIHGRKAHNRNQPRVITPKSDRSHGSYVLADDMRIWAVLTTEEARQALARRGLGSLGSRNNNAGIGAATAAPEGFKWASATYENKGLAEAAAARKAAHKTTTTRKASVNARNLNLYHRPENNRPYMMVEAKMPTSTKVKRWGFGSSNQ